MTTAEETPGLPSRAHPTAKAFFDALDARQAGAPGLSSTLQRQSQSLGWRNRYSQAEDYPVKMNISDSQVSFTVKQVQRGEVEGTYGTGATVWPAAMVLLKYLEVQPQLIRGKRVVDLGAGTGVTSLAAALLGAQSVVCTDGDERVVQLAWDNCRQSGLGAPTTTATSDETSIDSSRELFIGKCPLSVQKYWWGADPVPDEQCQVVLVADCVLPKLYPIAPLVQAIDELLPDNHGVALLSYEHRWYPDYDPRDKFKELAAARGLGVETIHSSQLDPVYNVDDIEVWHVTRLSDSETTESTTTA